MDPVPTPMTMLQRRVADLETIVSELAERVERLEPPAEPEPPTEPEGTT